MISFLNMANVFPSVKFIFIFSTARSSMSCSLATLTDLKVKKLNRALSSVIVMKEASDLY